jgi:hypothetical protein
MKPLKPDSNFDLGHRAYFLRGWPGNSMFIAASQDGHVSLVDAVSKTVRAHRPTKKLEAICPHPTKPLVALVDGKSGYLFVQDLAGKTIAEIRPPQIAAGSSRAVKQGFANCYFDEAGDVLWVVAPLSTDEGELLLVETEGWSAVHSAVVEDPFGASFWSFYHTGRPGLVSLWIAAGQDGQQVYWLSRDSGSFSVEEVDELANCMPPVFSPDGSEFLVVTDRQTICRYDFLEMKQLGSPWDSGDEDDRFAESLCYVDHRHVLAGTGGGKTFLVDVQQMAVVDEIAIEGHGPRPIGDYFPTLAMGRGSATDISGFDRLGNVVVFIYRREGRTILRNWKDSLLFHSLAK